MSQKRVAFEQDLDSDKHALLNRSSELFYTTSEIGPVASVVNFGNETSQTRQRPVYDRASSASPYASYPAHASESSQTGDISNNAPKGYGLGIGSTSPGRNVRNTSISSMPSPAISFILDDGLQDGRESPVSTWSKAQSFSSARPLYHKAALSEDGDRASTTRSTKSYAGMFHRNPIRVISMLMKAKNSLQDKIAHRKSRYGNRQVITSRSFC